MKPKNGLKRFLIFSLVFSIIASLYLSYVIAIPFVEIIAPSDSEEVLSNITIVVNATDGAGISSVFANITLPNSTIRSLKLSFIDGFYRINFTELSLRGNYLFLAYANNSLDERNISEGNFTGVDTTVPIVTDPLPESGLTYNPLSNVALSVAVSDFDLDVVKAKVLLPDLSEEKITLIETGTIYQGFFSNTLLAGTYGVTFIANDSSNNLNYSTETFFSINETVDLELVELSYSPETFEEGEVVFLTINVTNNGNFNINNAETVCWLNGGLFYTQTFSLSGFSSIILSPNLTIGLGTNNVFCSVDYDDSFSEIDEQNNNFTFTLNVSSYQTFHGEATLKLALGSEESTLFQVTIPPDNLYVSSSEEIDFTSLEAIGMNASQDNSNSDFLEIDVTLNSSSLPDSINRSYSSDGDLALEVDNFTIVGQTINEVPIANSSTSGGFVTGILWDESDDAGSSVLGEYDGEESLVFVTKVKDEQETEFGLVDYVTKVPALVRDESNLVYLYMEYSD
jgi:uncharacterized repeat protein (TIGR01451 family)